LNDVHKFLLGSHLEKKIVTGGILFSTWGPPAKGFYDFKNTADTKATVLVRVWVLFFYNQKKIKKCGFCVLQFWTPSLARLLFIYF
jgi:hypothetical protein